jgi:RNA polymerase sigma-70 factor (ECF subfamily)
VSADETRLIAEALRGNTAAFGVLVHRYQDRLYHSVYGLTGNAEDAQDVVQEAFLCAYESLDSFKGDSRFFTWLYRIAINTAISLRRKRRVMIQRETGSDCEQGIDPLDPSPESRPEHGLEQVEQSRRVWDALRRLSPEHRDVLVMKDMDGQKYETMAEILQVPIGTIRSRLHRARLELRELLKRSENYRF